MAQNNFAFLALLVVTSTVTLASADEQTKTVEFNVKPGGMVHTFSEKMVSNIASHNIQPTNSIVLLDS